MKKDILLHTIDKLIVRLKGTTSNLQALRAMLLMMVMVVGVTGVWGQETDYSGTYYIANSVGYNSTNATNNFYLVPATNANYDTNQPHLTTSKTGQVSNCCWQIIKNGDYYRIIHVEDERYLTANPAYGGTSGNNVGRLRVHLETMETPDDNTLFEIKPNSNGGYNIRHKDMSDKINNSTTTYLDPAGGNIDGTNLTNARTATTTNGEINVGGGIGYWTDEPAARWMFEDVIARPTISYNSDNLIEITAAQTGATIIYTIDGSIPSTTNGTEVSSNTTSFDPSDDVTTIKAIAIVNEEESNVATFTPTVLLGQNHKRLIQSQNNAWNTTDFHFYMIPGDEANGILKVNTTSLFRPSMEWYFLNAGIENGVQYYYIVNNANSKYLCYDATNSVYMESFSSGNKFKFKILESPTAGTYNIYPYGQNIIINKNTNNANSGAINTSNYSANNANSGNTRWKFVLPSALDKTAPFTASDASSTIYYTISSVGSPNYYIVPPSGNNTNVTTTNSSDANVVKSGVWFFEVAQAASETDWLTYYYIRNAETGKYLYFTKDANNAGACLVMKETIENGNEDRYMFTWAKTADANVNYYIIPKLLKDASKNNFSSLQKNNGTLQSNLTRGAGNYAWTFTSADLFCNEPVFEEEEGVIKIKCNTNAAKIYINTESDANPTDGSTLYNPTQVSTQNWAIDKQVRIKAIAVVSDGTNTASSAVITLLNKPDVTLAGGPYTYNGTAWEPSVTSVSIGETIAPTAPAATYTVAYENNINAGTASVNITDAEPTDTWYLWNVPVTEFTIDRKAVTITAKSASKLYNGTPLTESGFTPGALETGDTHTFTVAMTPGSTITNAGTQPNVIRTVDGTAVTTGTETTVGNYLVTTVNGTLTVNRKAVTITANDASKEYDSTPLTEGGFTSGELETGDTHAFTVVMTPGSTITNAGTQPNVIGTVDGTAVTTGTETMVGNYLVTTLNGTLTVSQKSIGNGSLAEGFTIDFDASDDVILKYGTYTLTEDDDYTTSTTQENDRYASRSISGSGNYTGNVAFRNAIAHFTTDANQEEWSATFVAENPGTTIGHALPEGISAYIISAINGNRVNAERLDYIPAGVPVLLLADEEKNGFLVTDANSESVTAITETQTGYNKLKEVTGGTAHFETREIYVLYKNEFVLNKEGDLALGKVYMENPNYGAASPSPARLFIDWANVADIKDIQKNGVLERTNDRWYTIGGRRLSGKPNTKGLYIFNGKKIVVK